MSKAEGYKPKLTAIKSKSPAAALLKCKDLIDKKQQIESKLSPEPCRFVPVRRKPLGEYMKAVEVEKASTSSAIIQGMSYAAVTSLNKSNGKIIISPRIKRGHKSRKYKAKEIIKNAKFSIFDVEQSKPHIICVDRPPVGTEGCPFPKLAVKKQNHMKLLPPNDIFKSNPVANANSNQEIQSETSPCEMEIERKPLFTDSISYLKYYHERLQAILKEQEPLLQMNLLRPKIKPVEIQAETGRFNDQRFVDLENMALFAQSRAMLETWKNLGQVNS